MEAIHETQQVDKYQLDLSHILYEKTRNTYRESIEEGSRYIVDFFNQKKFYSGIQYEELKNRVEQIAPQKNNRISLSDALKEIRHAYIDNAIAFHNTSYIAHLNCPVLIPTLVAELISNALNTAVETWDQSTGATLIEEHLINWICDKTGMPATADGVFTSGGTQSNLMALLLARDAHAEKSQGTNIKLDGVPENIGKYKIFCSEKAHYSIKKNAGVLGMGYNAVVEVETDDAYRMCLEALEEAIEKELASGNIPIAIVATAGTTDFGSIDPLREIAGMAKKYNIWMHTDGAYGGALVVSDHLKTKLEGIEFSDSITIDFHKTLFQPVCSSVFLTRDKQDFKYVSHYADYLNPIETKESPMPNLVVKSLQTTRRFDALKLWFTLKMTGEEVLGKYLEKICQLTQETHQILENDPWFETIHQPELSTVIFRYKPMKILPSNMLSAINLYIKNNYLNLGKHQWPVQK